MADWLAFIQERHAVNPWVFLTLYVATIPPGWYAVWRIVAALRRCPPQKSRPGTLSEGRRHIAADVQDSRQGKVWHFSGVLLDARSEAAVPKRGRSAHPVGVGSLIVCYAAAR